MFFKTSHKCYRLWNNSRKTKGQSSICLPYGFKVVLHHRSKHKKSECMGVRVCRWVEGELRRIVRHVMSHWNTHTHLEIVLHHNNSVCRFAIKSLTMSLWFFYSFFEKPFRLCVLYTMQCNAEKKQIVSKEEK